MKSQANDDVNKSRRAGVSPGASDSSSGAIEKSRAGEEHGAARKARARFFCSLLVWAAALVYIALSLFTLTDFPVVHSDELWLSAINAGIVDNRLADTTEPFFDLYPRVSHPFRWLYNLMLAPLTRAVRTVRARETGHPAGGIVSVLPVRILAFAASLCALFVFAAILRRRGIHPAGAAPLALAVPFVAASHIGRQEPLIMLAMLLCYHYASQNRVLPASVVTVLAMGVHPNSLLVGAVGFAVLRSRSRLRFVLGAAAGFAVHAGIGLWHNPGFIGGYLAFGRTQGIRTGIPERLTDFALFWYKLFLRIGGTYELYDVRALLIAAGSVLLWFWIRAAVSLLRGAKSKARHIPDGLRNAGFALTSILFGILAIGRFSQLSFVMVLPFALLLAYEAALEFAPRVRRSRRGSAAAALIAAAVLLTVSNLAQNLRAYDRKHFYELDYVAMNARIASSVPFDAVTLGNLNILEAHDYRRFYDVRNLDGLRQAGLSFADYVRRNKIEYIILHDEMDYIYRNIGRWHILYGDLAYYPEMRVFLERYCEPVDRFENPVYAMRIAEFSGSFPWATTIYRVKRGAPSGSLNPPTQATRGGPAR